MKTTEEIIKYMEIRKEVHEEFVQQDKAKILYEITSGLEHTSFVTAKLLQIEGHVCKIEELDETIKYIKGE